VTKVSSPCCLMMVIWPLGPNTIDSVKTGGGVGAGMMITG
jgi:hypothetical protein